MWSWRAHFLSPSLTLCLFAVASTLPNAEERSRGKQKGLQGLPEPEPFKKENTTLPLYEVAGRQLGSAHACRTAAGRGADRHETLRIHGGRSGQRRRSSHRGAATTASSHVRRPRRQPQDQPFHTQMVYIRRFLGSVVSNMSTLQVLIGILCFESKLTTAW